MLIGQEPKWRFNRWSSFIYTFIHFLELFQYYTSDEIMLGKLLPLLPSTAESNTYKKLQLFPTTLKSKFINAACKIWSLSFVASGLMLVSMASLW